MTTSTEQALASRAISAHQVRPDGRLTVPPSYGVYQLPASSAATRRYRFGNHPVRQSELQREFGSCDLLYLFLHRPDAEAMAAILDEQGSQEAAE